MPPFADVLKWEHLPFPKSLPQFQKLFPDDAACASYLERVRWEKGFVCPLCETKGEPYRFTARPGVLESSLQSMIGHNGAPLEVSPPVAPPSPPVVLPVVELVPAQPAPPPVPLDPTANGNAA